MKKFGVPFWRSVPLLRILLPFIAGIVLEKYLPVSIYMPFAAGFAVLLILMFRFLPSSKKYVFRWVNGSAIYILMIYAGVQLMHWRNIENNKSWIVYQLQQTAGFVSSQSLSQQSIDFVRTQNRQQQALPLLVTLHENPVNKPNSYKAIADIESILINDKWKPVKGKLLLYFKKDSMPVLQYGSQLIIRKPLQAISNSGNPGEFDYRQYCASQDIYHQVYLLPNDYKILPGQHGNRLQQWLLQMHSRVLSVLRKYIPGEKELGVAEALLIGYRNDLDKDLVKSYSLTGVVHIIAISGLHLGMIYGLMLWLLKPLRKRKWIHWARPVIILAVLWGFSLLSGAAASILRSAVMFTFIIIGEGLQRKTNAYNTLAASALCMLVYDPYFLWDVGFQLSYLAVLSIMLFMQPIYRLVYCSNKLLDAIWKLNAITLSAQILTLPVILFYFHQFPNLFLFTNFIAVPLSGFILYGELLLLVCSAIPWFNTFIGDTLSFLIRLMNGIIERTGRLPFAVSENIQLSLIQVGLLYLFIGLFVYWLLQKKPGYLIAGMSCMMAFCLSNTIETFQQKRQHVLVVYNIPKQTAMDIMEGQHYTYWGDSTVPGSRFMNDFHLQPSRVLYGASPGKLNHTFINGNALTTNNKSVFVYDGSLPLPAIGHKITVDLIIIRGNPRLYLSQLAAVFDCPQYVFDSSNPLWKIRYWKKDADSLHLRHHSVPEQGAFIMAL